MEIKFHLALFLERMGKSNEEALRTQSQEFVRLFPLERVRARSIILDVLQRAGLRHARP